MIRSILNSLLSDDEKGIVIQKIIEDAVATDPTIEPAKILRGAGFVFTPVNIESTDTRH